MVWCTCDRGVRVGNRHFCRHIRGLVSVRAEQQHCRTRGSKIAEVSKLGHLNVKSARCGRADVCMRACVCTCVRSRYINPSLSVVCVCTVRGGELIWPYATCLGKKRMIFAYPGVRRKLSNFCGIKQVRVLDVDHDHVATQLSKVRLSLSLHSSATTVLGSKYIDICMKILLT